jgi:hypothetical protein
MAGQLIVQNSYNNPILTSVSVRYNNAEYQAENVFPVMPVDKRTGTYFVYDKTNLRVPGSTARAGLARANRVDQNVTKSTYGPLTEHALEQGVPEDLMREAADPLSPLQDATMNIMDKILLEKEQGLANYITTGNITANTSLSGGSKWDQYTTSNPLLDVQTGINTMKQSGVSPNTLVMSYSVWTQLLNHPVFQDRIKYSQLGVFTTELAARLFNVQRIVVCEAIVNSAADGLTDSLGYVWGKFALLTRWEPNPTPRSVVGGFHLTIPAMRRTDNWYEQPVDGYFARTRDYYNRTIFAQEALYLIATAVN